MAWFSRWTIHWLVTPTITGSFLPPTHHESTSGLKTSTTTTKNKAKQNKANTVNLSEEKLGNSLEEHIGTIPLLWPCEFSLSTLGCQLGLSLCRTGIIAFVVTVGCSFLSYLEDTIHIGSCSLNLTTPPPNLSCVH